MLSNDEKKYFAPDPGLLPLYEGLKEAVEALVGPFDLRIHKTQISFRKKYNFAVVSLPYRRMKGWPEHCLILTFVLPRHIRDPRVAISTEAKPGLFTHHVLLETEKDIDATVLDWIREAHDYAGRAR